MTLQTSSKASILMFVAVPTLRLLLLKITNYVSESAYSCKEASYAQRLVESMITNYELVPSEREQRLLGAASRREELLRYYELRTCTERSRWRSLS
jgi:hypothetical protein